MRLREAREDDVGGGNGKQKSRGRTISQGGIKNLSLFANEIGARLKLLLRPTVMADVLPYSGSRVVFFRRGLLDKEDDNNVQRRCLICDKLSTGELRLSISAVNPILDMEDDAIIHMMCCGSTNCRDRLDTIADQTFYNDRFKEALDAMEHAVS
jgi:hypothetical protein